MALSKEALDNINGAGAHDELMAARERNRAERPGFKDIRDGLSGVAVHGVVDPEDSQRIHTGEVPAVQSNETRRISVDDRGEERAVTVRRVQAD